MIHIYIDGQLFDLKGTERVPKSEMLFVFFNFLDCQICLSLPVSLFFPRPCSALYLADIVLACQASAWTFVKIAIKINQTFTVQAGLTLTIESNTSGVAR